MILKTRDIFLLFFFSFIRLKSGCGIVNKKHRIVGGHETVVNQYPWMGLMQYNGRFYCGCSLINDRYVLTAAHCVQGFQARRISVVLLDHNRAKPEDTNIITRKVGMFDNNDNHIPTNQKN